MSSYFKCVFFAIAFSMIIVSAWGAEEQQRLDGLFAVKIGKVMNASEECVTNDLGDLVFDYTPVKQFQGFSVYRLFATPLTRQVHQIRAVEFCEFDEVEDVMNQAIRVLEMKFGKPRTFNSKTKIFDFNNDDMIIVQRDGSQVKIDAYCKKLGDLATLERVKAEKERYADDIKVLALLPGKEDGDDRIYRIDSLFGIKFGETFDKRSEKMEKTADGAWRYTFNPTKRFMGCQYYFAFATGKDKKVYQIRAVYAGSGYTFRSSQIRRVIESVTGRKMKEGDDNKEMSMKFGDYFILINEDRVHEFTAINFYKGSLFLQMIKENEDAKRRAARAELDAL